MNHANKIAREDFIAEALRAVDSAIGEDQPTAQALRIIEALKRLRAEKAVRITSEQPIDYLTMLQDKARAAWAATHAADCVGPLYDIATGVDTPIGRLRIITWRTPWRGRRGSRLAWATEYYLDDAPITLAEIRLAGLAQRPTTRQRKSR